jgi:hypothetical protein
MIKKFDSGLKSPSESGPKRKGVVFLEPWHGLVLSKLEVRGVVIGFMRIGTGGYQLLIDDGTGRISAVAWESDGPQVLPKINPESIYNKYVSVRGTLVGFRAEIQIRIESVDIISDEPTEEQLWWLDVKEEWENLAAKSRAEISPSDNPYCPCLCHAGTGRLNLTRRLQL